MNQKISIVIAEDQPILRRAFVTLLNGINDFEVIGDAANGKELIQILKSCKPDIILLDLRMPKPDGWQTLELIRKRFIGSKVIILSNNDDMAILEKAMSNGATGFVSKNDEVEELIYAIRDVYYVGKYYSKCISDILAKYTKETVIVLSNDEALSEREKQIVKEVCNGLSNNLISEKLFISVSTVDFHRKNIYKKTNSGNVLDLFKYALRNNIVSIDAVASGNS